MTHRDHTTVNGETHQRSRERDRAICRHGICLCVAGIVAFAAGCSPAIKSFRVEVRDAMTHEPARNVTVFADVPSKNHPFSVASLLGQTGPVDTRGKTNLSGIVELKRIDGRPVRLGVLCAGWAVGEVYVDPDATGFYAQSWFRTADFDADGSRTPEFLILP